MIRRAKTAAGAMWAALFVSLLWGPSAKADSQEDWQKVIASAVVDLQVRVKRAQKDVKTAKTTQDRELAQTLLEAHLQMLMTPKLGSLMPVPGQAGKFDGEIFHIVRYVDERSLLCRPANRQAIGEGKSRMTIRIWKIDPEMPVIFRGVSRRRIKPGEEYIPQGYWEVIEEETYRTKDGRREKAAVVRRLDIDPDREVRYTLWQDDTGNYSVWTELVSFDGNAVRLRKVNGKEVTVPLSRLSAPCRKRLERMQKRKAEVADP